MNWTPYSIGLVLHYFACPVKHASFDLPLHKEVTDELCRDGILAPNEFGYFDILPRGSALVKAWCETPIPIQKWVDPRFETDNP